MEEYLKHIEIFHRDLLSSQSKKEKYIKCKDCENVKRFIINENELIYSCGSKDSGLCGDQFKINIPNYIHYEKIMKTFQETIHGSFHYEPNIKDLSEYNIEELSKYIKLDEELKEYNELKETIQKDSQKLKSFFSSSNKFKQYFDSLNDLNNLVQKNNIRKKKILFDLQHEKTLTLEDTMRLRKEYAKIVHTEKNESYPMYESILNYQNNQYLLLEPKETYIEKYQTKYLETRVTKKKKKKKEETGSKEDDDEEETQQLIDIIIDFMKDNNGIMKKKDFMEIKGDYKTKWDNRLFSSLRYIPGSKNTNPWKKKVQEKYGPIIEKPVSSGLKIEMTQNWKDYLNIKNKFEKKLGDELEDLEVEMAKEISKEQSDKKKSDKKSIKYFSRSKNNKWLSAFNQAEPFEYDGYTYPTVEHAFHAQKIDPKDSKVKEYKEYLSNLDLKPNEAKKYGGKTSFKKNKFTFRDDWDKIKLKLMEDKELLHTGPRIDPFWGLTKDGGENNHGKILMKLREKYS